jgi:hypothetical protein
LILAIVDNPLLAVIVSCALRRSCRSVSD